MTDTNTEAQTITLSVLLVCPGARPADIAEVSGLALNDVCDALIALVDAGRVKADPNGETFRRAECPRPTKRWS